MPPVEAPQAAQDVQSENPLNKKLSGIIYPPPEVRNIVDKTATFVARNGPSFEERIKQNEINNPKFNFLTPTDPYHAYYRHKVKEVMDGGGQEPVIAKPSSIPRAHAIQEAAKQEVVAEAPPDPEFVADPPSIAAADIDVVKLTAQFVAKNGRSFLTSLMNKEQRNYQFDFLRPQHSLFSYFTKLVEQYTKVMLPARDCIEKLQEESDSPREVLCQVSGRVAWQQQQQLEKRKEEEAKEKERVAYAQIAWHEFLVVETVDYPVGETGNFPPPTTPDDVGARILQQERMDEARESGEPDANQQDDDETPAAERDMEMEVSDNEESESDDEAETPPTVEMGPPSAAPEPSSLQPAVSRAGDIVVRDYDPKSSRQTGPPTGSEQWLISPLTNEKIPAHKLQEHMKISLLDPKWREQKERTIREKSEQETVFAAGENIEANLRQIAERRSDIFGTGLDEAEIGKKIGEENLRGNEKMVWDGHSASVDKVSQRARENISIEEQIKVLHQTKGLVEDESKSRIGPSVTRAQAASTSSIQVRSIAPPSVPRMPVSHPPPTRPPMLGLRPPVPPPPVSVRTNRPPVAVQPPSIPSQPMGVPPAPQPIQRPVMIPPTGVMMMGGPRPPMPQLPPMLGMPALAVPAVPPMFRPAMPPAPVGVPVPPIRHHVDDEPPTKRTKTEESLIPEHQWLAQRQGPVMVKVACPTLPDKPEWKLAGQTLAFTFAPQESCGAIKAKVAEVLGMPSGKQKLQYEGIFIKDQNSLAYYNFLPESVVHLSTKERGGRKK